jgi:hypothetical protein
VTSEDELDEGSADVTDPTTAHPICVMTRVDSASTVTTTTLADAENNDKLRKNLNKHRVNQSVSTLPPEELSTSGTNGISIITSPTALKMLPRHKDSMSSIASVSENSSSALASPASPSFPASPTITTITSPMMRMPSLTDLALTAQAAHHSEAAETAVGRILATLQSIANVMEASETSNNDNAEDGAPPTSPDFGRLTGSLTAQSVAVLSTVQQLHSALAGIMLPKALIDTAAISTHADRGQRLMDAFRELDGIRSQLLQEAQQLSSTVRKSRTTDEILPTADLINRANRILQAADAAVAGARAVARQKEVLSRLLARDQVSLLASPINEANDSAASINSQPNDNNTNYHMQNDNNSNNNNNNNDTPHTSNLSSSLPLSTTNVNTVGSPSNTNPAAISFETRMVTNRRTKSISQLRNGVANDGNVQPNLLRNVHTIGMSANSTNLAITSRRSLSHRRGTPSESQVVMGQASRAMVVDTMNIPAVPPTPTLTTPPSAALASPPHDVSGRRTPSGELNLNESNYVPLLKSRSSNGNPQTGLPVRPLFNRNHTVDVLPDSVRMLARTRSNSALPMAIPSSPLLSPIDSPGTPTGQQQRMVTHRSAERLNNESLVSRMTRPRRVTDASIFIPPPPPSTTPPFNVEVRRTISQGSLLPNSPPSSATTAGRLSPGTQPRKHSESQCRPSMLSITVPPHTAPASPGLHPTMPEPPKSADPRSRSFPVDLSDDVPPNDNLLPMPVQQVPGTPNRTASIVKSHNVRGRSCSVGSLTEFIAIGSSPRPGLPSNNVGLVQRRHQPINSLAMPTLPVAEESLLPPLAETLNKASPVNQPARLEQLDVNRPQSIISNISNNQSQNSIDTVTSSLYGYDAMELTPDNIESTTPTPINVSAEDVRTEFNFDVSPKRIFNGDINATTSNGELNEATNHGDGLTAHNSASIGDPNITVGVSNGQNEESTIQAATSPDSSHIANDEDEERFDTTTTTEDDGEKGLTRSTSPRVKSSPTADHLVNSSTIVGGDGNVLSTNEHSEESESDDRQAVSSKRVQFIDDTSDSDLDDRIDDDDDETMENGIEQNNHQDDEVVDNEQEEEEEDEDKDEEENETPEFLEVIK